MDLYPIFSGHPDGTIFIIRYSTGKYPSIVVKRGDSLLGPDQFTVTSGWEAKLGILMNNPVSEWSNAHSPNHETYESIAVWAGTDDDRDAKAKWVIQHQLKESGLPTLNNTTLTRLIGGLRDAGFTIEPSFTIEPKGA